MPLNDWVCHPCTHPLLSDPSKGELQMGFHWINHQILHLVMKIKQFKGWSLVGRTANNYLLICRCQRKLIYYTKNPTLHLCLPVFNAHMQLFKLMDTKRKSLKYLCLSSNSTIEKNGILVSIVLTIKISVGIIYMYLFYHLYIYIF